LEAFSNNEHCVQFAIAKLFVCFFSIVTTYSRIIENNNDTIKVDGGSSSNISNNNNVVNENNILIKNNNINTDNTDNKNNIKNDNKNNTKNISKSTQVKNEYKNYVEYYLKISSQILLTFRLKNELPSFKNFPFRPMCFMLEYFLKLSNGIIEIDSLEKFFSNSLLRNGLLDISLGFFFLYIIYFFIFFYIFILNFIFYIYIINIFKKKKKKCFENKYLLFYFFLFFILLNIIHN
jgi:hypothetical protein